MVAELLLLILTEYPVGSDSRLVKSARACFKPGLLSALMVICEGKIKLPAFTVIATGCGMMDILFWAKAASRLKRNVPRSVIFFILAKLLFSCRLFVNFSFSHYKTGMLQQRDVFQRISFHRNDISEIVHLYPSQGLLFAQ